MTEALNQSQIDQFGDQGYLVLENRVPMDWIARIRDEIARFEAEARGMKASNDRIDLEDTHRPDAPRRYRYSGGR